MMGFFCSYKCLIFWWLDGWQGCGFLNRIDFMFLPFFLGFGCFLWGLGGRWPHKLAPKQNHDLEFSSKIQYNAARKCPNGQIMNPFPNGQIIATFSADWSPATHQDPKPDHDFHFNANNANYSRTSSNFNTLRKEGIRLAWRLNGCNKKWCVGSIVGKSHVPLDYQVVCLNKRFCCIFTPDRFGKIWSNLTNAHIFFKWSGSTTE